MKIHEQLGTILLSSLADIRQKKGEINMVDIGSVLEIISKEMNQLNSENNKNLLQEVKQLAEFLEKTKEEIVHVNVAQVPNYSAADATMHLEAIIQSTEEAGHKIMDAVSVIQEEAAKIGGDTEKVINGEITKIYEACNFQDLTTQRITKVMKILDGVGVKIDNMLKLFGTSTEVADKPTGDAALLNGPQLPGLAPSQSDIDAMFSGLDNRP